MGVSVGVVVAVVVVVSAAEPVEQVVVAVVSTEGPMLRPEADSTKSVVE